MHTKIQTIEASALSKEGSILFYIHASVHTLNIHKCINYINYANGFYHCLWFILQQASRLSRSGLARSSRLHTVHGLSANRKDVQCFTYRQLCTHTALAYNSFTRLNQFWGTLGASSHRAATITLFFVCEIMYKQVQNGS